MFQYPDDCMDGEIRLQDGTQPSNGRVEVCQNGIWGSVCNDMWDDADASVVCRQLGYDPQSTCLRGGSRMHKKGVLEIMLAYCS